MGFEEVKHLVEIETEQAGAGGVDAAQRFQCLFGTDNVTHWSPAFLSPLIALSGVRSSWLKPETSWSCRSASVLDAHAPHCNRKPTPRSARISSRPPRIASETVNGMI